MRKYFRDIFGQNYCKNLVPVDRIFVSFFDISTFKYSGESKSILASMKYRNSKDTDKYNYVIIFHKDSNSWDALTNTDSPGAIKSIFLRNLKKKTQKKY